MGSKTIFRLGTRDYSPQRDSLSLPSKISQMSEDTPASERYTETSTVSLVLLPEWLGPTRSAEKVQIHDRVRLLSSPLNDTATTGHKTDTGLKHRDWRRQRYKNFFTACIHSAASSHIHLPVQNTHTTKFSESKKLMLLKPQLQSAVPDIEIENLSFLALA